MTDWGQSIKVLEVVTSVSGLSRLQDNISSFLDSVFGPETNPKNFADHASSVQSNSSKQPPNPYFGGNCHQLRCDAGGTVQYALLLMFYTPERFHISHQTHPSFGASQLASSGDKNNSYEVLKKDSGMLFVSFRLSRTETTTTLQTAEGRN
eukprot:754731-Hanusia_phi.AAC.3